MRINFLDELLSRINRTFDFSLLLVLVSLDGILSDG